MISGSAIGVDQATVYRQAQKHAPEFERRLRCAKGRRYHRTVFGSINVPQRMDFAVR